MIPFLYMRVINKKKTKNIGEKSQGTPGAARS